MRSYSPPNNRQQNQKLDSWDLVWEMLWTHWFFIGFWIPKLGFSRNSEGTCFFVNRGWPPMLINREGPIFGHSWVINMNLTLLYSLQDIGRNVNSVCWTAELYHLYQPGGVNKIQGVSRLTFDRQVMSKYWGKNPGTLPPHPYAISDVAYRQMLRDRKNQDGAERGRVRALLPQFMAWTCRKWDFRHSLNFQPTIRCLSLLSWF